MMYRSFTICCLVVLFSIPMPGRGADYNAAILDALDEMPAGGIYARYQRSRPPANRLDDLHETVASLHRSLQVGLGGRLKVNPGASADYSFCSSATYLLFCEVIARLQRDGMVPANKALSHELAGVGDKNAVIGGKLDGIGLFGHWNADGPGTAVLFHRLDLGSNFQRFEAAKPGDFLKIFWNDSIGKGERGHLVLYLGASADGQRIQVWSSNMNNENGSHGYGTMWVDRSRIKRAVFSRLERPENLMRWLSFSETEKRSEYLIGIRKVPSTPVEMAEAVGLID